MDIQGKFMISETSNSNSNSNHSIKSEDIDMCMTYEENEIERGPCSFVLFGSPDEEENKTPNRRATCKFDFFEDRQQQSAFPGIFGGSSVHMITEGAKELSLREKPGKALFGFDSSHDSPDTAANDYPNKWDPLFPSKRQRSEKRPSPKDVMQLPETPIPFTPKSLIKSSLQKFRNNYIQDDSQMNVEISRLAKDFEIVEVIGTGTFGTVYRARGRLDNILYAVKRSRSRFRGNIDRERTMHEVHALAELSSKEDADKTMNIVRYYSAWIEDEHVCIQMELCDTSVDGLIMAGHKFEKKEIFGLLRDVLLALDLLHRNEFVHLDIKPANILRKGQHYKLGDFGLALHTDHGKSGGFVEEGDCRYMARELLNWGVIPDLTKCDIFSLGITALEVASGQPVAAEGPDWQRLRNGLTADLEEVQGVPTDLFELLRVLMSPKPEDRPSAHSCLETFSSLKSDLERELLFFKTQASSLMKALDKNQGTRLLKRCHTISGPY